jgi:hypothetical protein
VIRQHTIMPPRCACGSIDVEHGYNFERHGYLQACNVCGLEMFWSSDLLTSEEVDAMVAMYQQERVVRSRQQKTANNIIPKGDHHHARKS